MVCALDTGQLQGQAGISGEEGSDGLVMSAEGMD